MKFSRKMLCVALLLAFSGQCAFGMRGMRWPDEEKNEWIARRTVELWDTFSKQGRVAKDRKSEAMISGFIKAIVDQEVAKKEKAWLAQQEKTPVEEKLLRRSHRRAQLISELSEKERIDPDMAKAIVESRLDEEERQRAVRLEQERPIVVVRRDIERRIDRLKRETSDLRDRLEYIRNLKEKGQRRSLRRHEKLALINESQTRETLRLKYDELRKLDRKLIDIKQLKVFKTPVMTAPTVFVGDFPERKEEPVVVEEEAPKKMSDEERADEIRSKIEELNEAGIPLKKRMNFYKDFDPGTTQYKYFRKAKEAWHKKLRVIWELENELKDIKRRQQPHRRGW